MAWNTLDWLDLMLRWFHIMGGISWIGGSLYLLWLDRIFADPERATSRKIPIECTPRVQATEQSKDGTGWESPTTKWFETLSGQSQP